MSEQVPTILLVEDDLVTRRFLADNLCADGFELLEAGSAAAAEQLMANSSPDLALVDLGLPDADGLELVRRVRRSDRISGRINPNLPLIVLSGRAGELDRLRGFERGCDDFVAKPFSYAELRARILAVLRRVQRRPVAGRLRVGSLEVDPAARQVWLAGRPVELSNKEIGLLRVLASDPCRVFTRAELLRIVWGYRSSGITRTVDTHAARLRRKLSGGDERFVVNVWGVGYRLIDAPAGESLCQE